MSTDPHDATPAVVTLGLTELAYLQGLLEQTDVVAGVASALQLPAIDHDDGALARSVVESLSMRGLAHIEADAVRYAPAIEALVSVLSEATDVVQVGTISQGVGIVQRIVFGPGLRLLFVPTSLGAYLVSFLKAERAPYEVVIDAIAAMCAESITTEVAVVVGASPDPGADPAPVVRMVLDTAGGPWTRERIAQEHGAALGHLLHALGPPDAAPPST